MLQHIAADLNLLGTYLPIIFNFQSRPSLDQVVAIVDFMEKHPTLALGQLRGLEGRDTSKKLWQKLTTIVNSTSGPNRPMKSWVKVFFLLIHNASLSSSGMLSSKKTEFLLKTSINP